MTPTRAQGDGAAKAAKVVSAVQWSELQRIRKEEITARWSAQGRALKASEHEGGRASLHKTHIRTSER